LDGLIGSPGQHQQQQQQVNEETEVQQQQPQPQQKGIPIIDDENPIDSHRLRHERHLQNSSNNQHQLTTGAATALRSSIAALPPLTTIDQVIGNTTYDNLLWSILHPQPETPLASMESAATFRTLKSNSDRVWSFVDRFIDKEFEGSVLVFGSNVGLLSNHISKRFAASPVVSIDGDIELVNNHTMRLKEFGLPNEVVCHRALSADLVQDLYYHSAAMFRYQVCARTLTLAAHHTIPQYTIVY
jgi:hypothetical protein